MAIAFVQQASQINSAAGTSISATVTALTTGNWLVVAGCNSATTLYSPGAITVGSGAIEYWDVGWKGTTARAANLLFAICRIRSGGATTVTINGPSGALAMEVIEFSATNQLILDVCSTGDGTATSVSSGAVATTSFSNELWIGANTFRNDTISTQNINGAAPDNSYSAVTTGFTTTANRGIGLAYKIASSTGTPSYTATLNQTSVWMAAIACLREIPSSGGSNTYSKSVMVNNRF